MRSWMVHPVHDPELDALYRKAVGFGRQVISVTQARAGEGTTTAAMALARRAAAAGRTVVLVDANTLRPALTESLSLPRTAWLPADGSACSALFHVPDLGLAVLSAPNVLDPIAFREPDALRRIFEHDLREFDLVVIDTSPVTEAHCEAIPAEVVAAASTATLLVIMAGVTPEPSVMRAVERLKQSGGTIAGAVFNDRFNPSLASDLQRRTRFLSKVAPRLTARLLSSIDRSAWLGANAR